MKKFYIPVIFFLLLTLSSCLDIEERYDFKADGSCNVAYDFDMSRAVSVLMNLMSDSLTATSQFKAAKDTSLVFFSAMPDSIQKKLTGDEINLAKSSNLRVQMDLKKSLMKVSITHQAKDSKELKYYIEHISKIAMSSKFDAVTKGEKSLNKFDAQQMVVGQDYYSYEVTPNKFYRIIDVTKFKEFLKKTQATFEMAKAMLIETPYKLVITFAKPVKKISNPKAVLSADRKHVTLQTNMDEIIKNPSAMDLKIDF